MYCSNNWIKGLLLIIIESVYWNVAKNEQKEFLNLNRESNRTRLDYEHNTWNLESGRKINEDSMGSSSDSKVNKEYSFLRVSSVNNIQFSTKVHFDSKFKDI